jgi:hypothetical protein
MVFTKESSPFDPSPFANSPRLFWKEQTISPKARFGSENEEEEPPSSRSPKRSSIENLKKASRVTHSNMFAREQKYEYDPAAVTALDRPLASGRPLSTQVQGNAYGGNGLTGLREQNDEQSKSHRRGQSLSKIPMLSSPTKLGSAFSSPVKESSSPAEARSSPTKSALSSSSRFDTAEYNPEMSIWSDDEEVKQTPRPLRRHAKSVTFDHAPPTINEYEMVTPAPSSIASESRQGSFDSEEEEEEDMSFDQDDSFDASLEDTDKTPVVLPEDWRHMSPDAANASLVDTYDDVFDTRDNSPMPTARPSSAARPNHSRHGSTNSDGESRPLPPLPGMQGFDDRRRRDSSVGLSAAAERASGSRRSLPQLPQAAGFSKSDLMNMRQGSMSLEDRLALLHCDDERNIETPTQEMEDHKDTSPGIQVQVSEVDDVTETETETDLTVDEPKVPRISRESILRKVKSGTFEDYDSYNYDPDSSPDLSYGDLADLDPDVPIPSREVSSNFDETPREHATAHEDEGDSVIDAYSFTETTEMYAEASLLEDYERDTSIARQDDYERESSVVHNEDFQRDNTVERHEVFERDTSVIHHQDYECDTSVIHNEDYERDTSVIRNQDYERDTSVIHNQDYEHDTSVIHNEDYERDTSVIHNQEYERDTSVIRHDVIGEPLDEDDASQYSPQPEEQPTSQHTIDTSGPSTPTAPNSSPMVADSASGHNGMFAFDDTDMDLSLDPSKPSFTKALSPLDTAPKIDAMREFLRRPETPEAGEEESDSEDPGTPDSVIHQPTVISPPARDSLVVPEPMATIKGAQLKTRPSLLPGDLDMAAARRQVSGEHPPPVPVRSAKRQSITPDFGHVEEGESYATLSNKENLMLDISIGEDSHDLSFGLDKEFDHIIEAQKVNNLFPLPSFAQFPTSTAAQTNGASQMSGEGLIYTYNPTNHYVREQKGYLMRQNTKVVVASSRAFSDEQPPPADGKTATDKTSKSANSSPRKSSAERKPAWTTEPWNGKQRRRSIRTTSGTKRATNGPVPPLPGQESAVATGLNSVEEKNDEEFEDGAERGRLFVKVVGVKDLDLPLPSTESTFFQLTLDNGLHCVTTAWLELGHTAPVGQEFELVVLDDLEFQLTLQTKLEPPAQPQVTATTPVKVMTHKKSHSAFRNFLSSPKKRKEQERKQQEEADRAAHEQQQQKEAVSKRNHQATAWDLLHNLVGQDGSFARAYVCLKNHENQAFGRPLNVDIPCFNEWAVDDSGISSVKSKRGGVVRRPPYRVGKLQLQLLFVPKPKNAKDEDMPKSMNACVRELREAEEIKQKTFEGVLSQQGGDCPVCHPHSSSLACAC